MVTDVFNQAQPYLIRRSAYDRTRGWTGFADFMGAGEDCDIFLQLEEVAHFEFIDEVLYHYRLHDDRASHALTSEAAFEMWRRLSDGAIARMGLPLSRVSAAPPFVYERLPRPAVTLEDVDFVIRGRAADAATWRMSGFRTTERRLVCFQSEDMEIQSRSALQAFVKALDATDADVLAPHLLGEEFILVRREVIVATGGFDEHYVPACLQAADFCLQARRRGFSCIDIPLEGVIDRGPLTAWTDADVAVLKSKWRSYAGLLDHLPQ